MEKRLTRDFFAQNTIKVAQALLGKYLIRQINCQRLIAQIVETEAYLGSQDKASHASFKSKRRCWPMYESPGTAYVYLIYGIYYMFNIVTERKGKPAAVLIRAVQPLLPNVDFSQLKKLGSGPGRLCNWLKIDKKINGEDLTTSKKLFLIDKGFKIKNDQIVRTTRIGVDYAGKWAQKKWRFYLKNNPFVSRR